MGRKKNPKTTMKVKKKSEKKNNLKWHILSLI
jgi:hypothetical protein